MQEALEPGWGAGQGEPGRGKAGPQGRFMWGQVLHSKQKGEGWRGEEPSPEKRDTSVLPVKGPSRVNTGRGALRGLAKWVKIFCLVSLSPSLSCAWREQASARCFVFLICIHSCTNNSASLPW